MTQQDDRLRHLSENLLALTRERGAKAQLARATGVQEANVSRYVHGKVMPPLEWLIDVAAHYAVSLDSLVGLSPPVSDTVRLREAVDFILRVRDGITLKDMKNGS